MLMSMMRYAEEDKTVQMSMMRLVKTNVENVQMNMLRMYRCT